MGFPKQEYWSVLPFLPPGNLPNAGIEPMYPVSAALPADSLFTEPSGMGVFKVVYFKFVVTKSQWNSLTFHWLGLQASTAVGPSSIPGQ